MRIIGNKVIHDLEKDDFSELILELIRYEFAYNSGEARKAFEYETVGRGCHNVKRSFVQGDFLF